MGKSYVFTYQGQAIKLCCKSCLKDFNKDPDKYLAKLKAPKESAKGDDSSTGGLHDQHEHHHRTG